MKKIMITFLLAVLCVSVQTPIVDATRKDYASLKIDTSAVSNEKQLVKRSQLIVYGRPDTAYEEYPTNTKVPGGKVVNFLQKIHVLQTMKGTTPQLITLLTEGIEPLPDRSSHLNKRYPGPLAEGEYICFLQRIAGTDLYSLVGIWQGVYPVFDGKTIALKEMGFASFNNLTIDAIKKQVQMLDKPGR
ncbi:hypothetical protein [Brevibacillus sp. SYSU BS000544]|uniref:hypothetical protein n=1 Tax=Brevibacillus sp. SYSU BS000544 TaxID=3416443 RepID=UPI003CE58CDA